MEIILGGDFIYFLSIYYQLCNNLRTRNTMCHTPSQVHFSIEILLLFCIQIVEVMFVDIKILMAHKTHFLHPCNLIL